MYQQQQQRQLEGVADLLANQGRYGDSMLVHMNPVEVQGLASMSPTGSLTVNPQTGQPEAFLPFLVPLLGSLAGQAALTGLGATAAVGGAAATAGLSSAAAGAIGSGLASWAATGDLKQGLVSGITGFGIGSALGGIGGAAKDAAAPQLGEAGFMEAFDPEIVAKIPGDAMPLAGLEATNLAMLTPAIDSNISSALAGAGKDAVSETVGQSFGDRAGQIFSKEGIEALTSTQALIPAAVAEGYNAEMAAEEAMRKFDKAGERMSEAELARQGEALLANQFNPNLTPAPYNPGGTDYGAQYANAGGIVSLDPSDFRRRYNGLMEMGTPIVGMFSGGGAPNIPINFGNQVGVGGYGNAIPAQQQAALRDPYSISPGQLQDVYAQQGMPGFGPEIMYFTPEKGSVVNPFKDWVPDPIAVPVEDGGEGGGTTGSETGGVNTTDKFIEVDLSGVGGGKIQIPNPAYIPPEGASGSEPAAETTTGTTTPASGSGLSAEDYANLYSQYMNYGSDFNISPFAEGGETQATFKKLKEASHTQLNDWVDRQIVARAAKGAARKIGGLFEDDEEKEEAIKAGIMAGITGAFSGHDFSDSMAEGGETQVNAEADRLIDLAAMAVSGQMSEEEAAVVIQAFIDEFGEEALLELRAKAAILGELPEEEAGVVVQAFIDEFGEEAFSALRESVLEGIVPGSQKEGEIVGPGGGMDDQIMGMIGNQQPVAVSPGEYIVPADVVSGIGDGSTDSGVQQLDGMLDRVRMERTNTTQQPRPLRKGGVLPR